MVNAELTNFVIAVSGVAVAIIAAFSKCMLKSRCTNISTPCISCSRDILPPDADIYKDSQENLNNV